MPHLHNEPDQHDMTVSAYVLRREGTDVLCMVHFHKKMDVLMQVGGHIELNETPWQSMAHELEEESGYELSELSVVQPFADRVQDIGNISHPVPFSMNTHNVGNEHYHSDLCYGFFAQDKPKKTTAEEESDDIRWLSLEDLRTLSENGEALQDVYYIYKYLIDHIDKYSQIPATSFSLQKPENSGATYKRGAPGNP